MLKVRIMLAALLLTCTTVMARDYETVAGDLLKTRIYRLDNGLTVYLSVNKEQPRIQTYVAVKTGSRNDPAETTGLAHYLEHLMFKGSSRFGSTNVEAERPLLDEIEDRFEQYRHVSDPQERKRLYHEIDSVSQLAAQYNIPNEYDKLMASIGSDGSNAFTSTDVTCYVEDIPSNEIENWAKVQADRFQDMVIRGFHTELEAVYEEKNITMASDMDKFYDALSAKLFPTHPYGTQTTIGTQEHLKNPSITNIKKYYHNYYCPNNTAIIMAGDFDPDEVMDILEKYFGGWKNNPTLSRPEFAPLAPITSPQDTSVVGMEMEMVGLGWRFDGGRTDQADTADVVADLLYNGRAGLLDIDLNQQMRVLQAQCFTEKLTDYSLMLALAMPKEGQSLEEARQLMLDEMGKIRRGEFSEDLLTSVVNNRKRRLYRDMEKNNQRARQMLNAFINDEPWSHAVSRISRVEGMTKEQIVSFANRHLTDQNFVCVYKRQGNDSTVQKIEKPEITPIPTNRDKQSDFVAEIVGSKPKPIEPKFIDFDRDMKRIKPNIIYKQNTENGLFSLSLVYEFGKESDRRLPIAFDLLEYAHTKHLSTQQLKEQFYKLACDYSFVSTASTVEIFLTGLNENKREALRLLATLINEAEVDKATYDDFVKLTLKAREEEKNNQEACYERLLSYATYGEYNPQRNIMSADELRNADPKTLLQLVKDLMGYEHTLLYYGPDTEKQLTAQLAELPLKKRLSATPTAHRYTQQLTPSNEVWLAPYEANNILMGQLNCEGREWSPDNAALHALFNEYFGGGMNGIVFQELREARGLAYRAQAYYAEPRRKGNKEYAMTYIATQTDKMGDCIREFRNIIDTIPQSEAAFTLAKSALTKRLATQRTTRFSVLQAWLAAQRRGIDYDINSRIYADLPNLTLQDIVNFEQTTMARKPYRFTILGNEADLDTRLLEQIAPIRRLTLEEIFGY